MVQLFHLSPFALSLLAQQYQKLSLICSSYIRKTDNWYKINYCTVMFLLHDTFQRDLVLSMIKGIKLEINNLYNMTFVDLEHRTVLHWNKCFGPQYLYRPSC